VGIDDRLPMSGHLVQPLVTNSQGGNDEPFFFQQLFAANGGDAFS